MCISNIKLSKHSKNMVVHGDTVWACFCEMIWMLPADAMVCLPYLSLPCSYYALAGCGSNPPPTLGRMTPPRALCMEYDCEGKSAGLDFLALCMLFASSFWNTKWKPDESQIFEKKKPVRQVMDNMQISCIRNPNPLGLCQTFGEWGWVYLFHLFSFLLF